MENVWYTDTAVHKISTWYFTYSPHPHLFFFSNADIFENLSSTIGPFYHGKIATYTVMTLCRILS